VGESVAAFHPSFSDDIARPHRTWPAIWELGYTWPDGVGPSEPKFGMLTVVILTRVRLQGEVDIVEGVNDEVPNASSLHTGPGNVSPSLSSPNRAMTDVTVFRVLYAAEPRPDRVGTLSTSMYKNAERGHRFPGPTAHPPDRTATHSPTATLAVVCRPMAPTTTDRRSTIMAADGAWKIRRALIRDAELVTLTGIFRRFPGMRWSVPQISLRSGSGRVTLATSQQTC